MTTKVENLIQPPIAITSSEWEQVASILRTHLPSHTIWAFGSRATGKHIKRFSDLDLLIDGPELTLLQSAMLQEAFDESPLPFKVDIAELASLTAKFRAQIEAPKILLMGRDK